MSVKTERIASNLVKEISYVINHEVKHKDIKFVTVTDVKLAPDLGYAKVYITTLNEEFKEETLDALKHTAGFIRHELRDRIDIRNIPILDFTYDESIDYGNKIEKLIDKLHKEEA